MIKVGFLLSYDFEYLKISLKYVYDYADLIVLCIDKDRLSWSGNPYLFDESIFDWVSDFDKEKKIKIYQDQFYIKENSSIQNDNYQRTKLAEYMGKGGWHIQLDTDEYFVNFDKFVDFLNSNNYLLSISKWIPIDIGSFLIPIIKKDKEGFIFVKDSKESFVLATTYPNYIAARRSKNIILFSSHYVFHQSLAREDEEIKFKIFNWGHNQDFNVQSYFNIWTHLDKHNVKYIKNFNPVYGSTWKNLEFIEASNINEFIEKYKVLNSLNVKYSYVLYKNIAQIILKLKAKFFG